MDCKKYPLSPNKIVAIATDRYLKPKHGFSEPDLPGGRVLQFGQDVTFGTGRKAPLGHDVGSTEAVLKPKMRKLLGEFAANDKSGMAKAMFDFYLKKQKQVMYYSSKAYREAAAKHENTNHFCHAALSAPTSKFKSKGKTRIHQALKAAGWDIKKMVAPTDLGVPAFNKGTKSLGTDDFGNGLGVMVNGLQYGFVVATHYHYDSTANAYCIRLKYIFYDVFGLDDDDLKEFGATSDGWSHTTAGVGITAWWQLQHQHAYAPMITWCAMTMTHESIAT